MVAIIKNAKRFKIEDGMIETAGEYFVGAELIVEFDEATKNIQRAIKRDVNYIVEYQDLETLPKYVKKLVKSFWFDKNVKVKVL